jgi:hypothetical protein
MVGRELKARLVTNRHASLRRCEFGEFNEKLTRELVRQAVGKGGGVRGTGVTAMTTAAQRTPMRGKILAKRHTEAT